MSYKWLGAVLVILGCGGCGWSLAADDRRRERCLRQLTQVLGVMECELQYHLTPLPDLCRLAAGEATGKLRLFFEEVAGELDGGSCPEVTDCIQSALRRHRDLPGNVRRLLHQLGRTLGRFDLPGQLQGLSAVKNACQRERQQLEENKGERLRNFQTLGLCAGAALVILFA